MCSTNSQEKVSNLEAKTITKHIEMWNLYAITTLYFSKHYESILKLNWYISEFCNRGDTILRHGGLHTDLNQCNQGS